MYSCRSDFLSYQFFSVFSNVDLFINLITTYNFFCVVEFSVTNLVTSILASVAVVSNLLLLQLKSTPLRRNVVLSDLDTVYLSGSMSNKSVMKTLFHTSRICGSTKPYYTSTTLWGNWSGVGLNWIVVRSCLEYQQNCD